MTILYILLFILNFSLILYYEKFVKLINIYDLPNSKLKRHKNKVPIIGGIILLINIFIYLIYQIFVFEKIFIYSLSQFSLREVVSIFFLLISLFILGFYDDKYKLTANTRLIYSIIIILITLILNNNLIVDRLYFSFLDKIIFLDKFSFIFTIFCFLALLNALNFFDGINAQSCTFFSFIFIYLFLKTNLHFFYIFIFIMLFFLLILNLKNKLFLGDSGVLFLGALFSVLLLLDYNSNQNIVYADEIFLLLFLPGVDLIRLTLTRFLKGKNIFEGDLSHIHHVLIARFSLLETNIILLILSTLPLISFIYLINNFIIVLGIFISIYLVIILNSKKK